MAILLEWVRNVAVGMVLITTVLRILPQNHFEKYIRFYTGLCILLLVVRPLFELFSLNPSLSQLFQNYVEKMEDPSLQKQMEEVEERREVSIYEQMEGQTEEQITEKLETFLDEEGITVKECQAVFDLDENSESYGQVQTVWILLEEEEQKGTISPPTVIIGNQIIVQVGEETESEGEKETGQSETKYKKELADEICRETADMVSIRPDQVSVTWESSLE